MMFPLYDDNDNGHSHHHHDFVHWGLLFFCIAVFGFEMFLLKTGGTKALGAFADSWSFEPKEYLPHGYTGLPLSSKIAMLAKCLAHLENLALLKMIGGIFVHGSLAHLFFNMLGLWFIGDNVQFAMGRLQYLAFFLLGGVVATCGHVVMATPNMFTSCIGASGAIFAVMAAYLFYFPRAHFIMFYFIGIFWGTMALPAWLVIGFYAIGETVAAIDGFGTDYGNIAVWAHVVGFFGGAILCFFFKRKLEHPLYAPADVKLYTKNARQVIKERREKNKHWDEWGP